MKMKSGIFAGVVLAASGLLGTALAGPIITVQSSGPYFAVLNLGTAASAGFQSNATLTNPGFGIASITFSGGSASGGTHPPSGVYAGSVGSVAKTPFPLGTPGSSLQNYLVAQANGGTVTITYYSPRTAFNVLWGTADTAANYNVIATGPGGMQTISGSQITSSADSGLYNYAVYVGNLNPFTTLTFSDSTTSSAFEFDIGQVPEPATLALMAAGLAALGWGIRRRKQKVIG